MCPVQVGVTPGLWHLPKHYYRFLPQGRSRKYALRGKFPDGPILGSFRNTNDPRIHAPRERRLRFRGESHPGDAWE